MEEVKIIATRQSFPCARIEWALRLKGVKYEYIEENLLNKSQLLLESNPVYKKVPVLLHNDKAISESLVILEYIDETWKHRPLLPQDQQERAQARFWAKFIDEKCILGVWGACVAEGEEKEKAKESALDSLALVEEQIRGKKYFGGEEIGYLDIVAGWITHWLAAMEEAGDVKILEPDRFPLLGEWGQLFIQASAIKECLPPKEKIVDYFSFGINYVRSLSANKA